MFKVEKKMTDRDKSSITKMNIFYFAKRQEIRLKDKPYFLNLLKAVEHKQFSFCKKKLTLMEVQSI